LDGSDGSDGWDRGKPVGGEQKPKAHRLHPPAYESEETVMKRGIGMIGGLGLALFLLFLAGCCTSQKEKLAGVYVSFETQECEGLPGVFYPPKKVKRLVLQPDMAALYFEDGHTEIYPIDPKKMKWFRWSVNPD
jgi:hypothetical protein